MEILASRMLLRPADYQQSLTFYRDRIGLAIAREYSGGTVFFAGQSLLELAGYGAPDHSGGPFPGALWLQVRDLEATQAELRGAGWPSPARRARSRGACTRCTSSTRTASRSSSSRSPQITRCAATPEVNGKRSPVN
ncbi:glyoxalase/Bleomycin resistance /Dioxygenase superfamily protein [Mycobacterium avium subsp. avium 2285 (R)]|nr:glyoxalase/Bleomycin resistance /Dioxygenase superfamily protein [Mycobacterium avium subsp. avium 2285 (R)]